MGIYDNVQVKEIPFDKNLPTALYVLRDDGGCGFYRCVQPAMALRRHQLFNTVTDMRTTTPEHILQADIVIMQEVGSPVSFETFHFALANKKPVVLEVDDYLHVVSPHNPGYQCWNPGTLYAHRFVEQLKRATAMMVSTPQLAREYFPYNPNIYVLPNYLNEQKWDNPLIKKKDGYLRIGWAGGNAHIDDLKMISKVIKKIIFEYKDKVKFETMGMLKHELGQTFEGLEEFHDTCPKCKYQGDSVTWSGEKLDSYPIVLASHGWDIALAPIVDTAFNSAKSDLKLKEYSAVGIPMVASRVTPYIEAEKDGCEAMLAGNFKEWYNNIKRLIDDENLRRQITEKNKAWVSKYWIDDNIQKHAAVYRQIIEFNKKITQKT